jgi:hypothetical protein
LNTVSRMAKIIKINIEIRNDLLIRYLLNIFIRR